MQGSQASAWFHVTLPAGPKSASRVPTVPEGHNATRRPPLQRHTGGRGGRAPQQQPAAAGCSGCRNSGGLAVAEAAQQRWVAMAMASTAGGGAAAAPTQYRWR
ncbi:hypothetical protein I4F81_005566 [Pyropia yezoensis]|uniref:Uncharacterized protein n=1 Tax=Pyropia yezoensis TaxID=2788 RepID=A0ACC3BZS4_PYRYE|nr:hypothetical protein I4F81_005566 [Neopyropia yezoensis]